MKENKVLRLNFNCEDGKTGSLTINVPKTDVTSQAIEQAMTEIIQTKAIGTKKSVFAEKVSAEMISRTVNEVYHV